MTDSLFTSGYGEVREKAGSKYNVSCLNCDYYYKAIGDKDEFCQNPDVLPFDVVVDGHRVYCSQWQEVRRIESIANIIKRRKANGQKKSK